MTSTDATPEPIVIVEPTPKCCDACARSPRQRAAYARQVAAVATEGGVQR